MSKVPLTVTFFLPVYNEERRLDRCLATILAQQYPRECIDIVVVDGGSQDGTRRLAKGYPCVRVLDNPGRLADLGVKICMQAARGDLFAVFAADNGLAGSDWLPTVAELFDRHATLSACWCRMIASDDDPAINRYYALIQNDPLSFFINRNLQHYCRAAAVDEVNGRTCRLFTVLKDKPLIWGANGLVYRRRAIDDIVNREGFLGDNDVFQCMVEKGDTEVAYIEGLHVYHHHVRSILQWCVKWRRDFGTHLLGNYKTRNMRWAFDSRFGLKVCAWCLYTVFPAFPVVHAAYLVIRDRSAYWLYHPLMNAAQFMTYVVLMLSNANGISLAGELLQGGRTRRC